MYLEPNVMAGSYALRKSITIVTTHEATANGDPKTRNKGKGKGKARQGRKGKVGKVRKGRERERESAGGRMVPYYCESSRSDASCAAQSESRCFASA